MPLEVYHHLRNAHSVVDLLEQPTLATPRAPPLPAPPTATERAIVDDPFRTVPSAAPPTLRVASTAAAPDVAACVVVQRSVHTQTTEAACAHIGTQTLSSEEVRADVDTGASNDATVSLPDLPGALPPMGRVAGVAPAPPTPCPPLSAANPLPPPPPIVGSWESVPPLRRGGGITPLDPAQRYPLEPMVAMDTASQRSVPLSEDTANAFRIPVNPESRELARCLSRGTSRLPFGGPDEWHNKKQRTGGDNVSIASGVSDFHLVYRNRLRCTEIASDEG